MYLVPLFFCVLFVTPSNSDLCELSLAKHNKYREIHHVAPLKCNSAISAEAQSYAEKIAIKCSIYERHDGIKYGENKAMYGYSADYFAPEIVAQRSVDDWYEQEKCYDYQKSNYDACYNTYQCTKYGCQVGLFTQVVWKGSREMGVGVANCTERKQGFYNTIVVTNYYPPGNIIGSFRQNVLKPPLNYWYTF